MTSPARSFTRDEATASSPFRNAFASSSTKPLHSPFLNRRSRASNDLSYTRRDTVSKSNTTRQPDAISTSSSTLVNAESTSDYRPWEVRSESSNSSLDSATISRGGRATPTLSALDDIGTLPSIHISPLPNRTASRNSRPPAAGRLSNESGRRSVDSSLTRARPVRQLCPDDCRCSDQDIDLGLCRRVVGSSSSGSDSASLSVSMHPMRQRATDPIPNSAPDVSGHNNDDMHINDNNIISIRQGGCSEHSSHSQSVSRSQGRDFDKDPILVPRSARSKGSARSPTASTYQRSFDQLQRGLDTLESNDSDADSDADQAAAAQQRAESMARWTARRTSLSQSSLDRRSPSSKLDLPPEATVSPPRSKGRTSLASDASMPRRTSESKLSDEQASPRFSSPLKATPGRKSIAAVFESMQKEREARAAEEHKQWQEKQARRERERAARAFGVPSRRRTSASSSQFDSPGSAYTAPDTPLSQTNNNTTAYQSMISNNSTTAYQSMVSRATPSRSPVSSLISASPLLSSPGSPKVDESAAADVQPRHLGEEAAGRIPETLAEDEELEAENDGIDQPSNIEAKPQVVEDEPEAEIALPTTPQTRNTSAFAFSSQPMALDLSPVRSVSDSSSPASSPRKNAHRRQNTNTVSVAARLPPASLGLARQRLNQVLRQAPEESTPVRNGDDESFEQAKVEVQPDVFPQTPIGILSSVKKKTLPQLSAARRGHSVRFSPRPDYRSDSGSWDDSGTHNEEEDNSREAAVSRLLLPAKQITIPEVLASASVPALPTPTHKAVIEEGTPISELEPSFEDQPQRLEPPAKLENTETPSKPHTPAIAALQTTDNDSMSASVAGSFSQSLRFPGAYAPTPVKKYSRHVIKPSPKVTRVLPLPEPQNRPPSPGAGEPFGLFPDPTVDSTSLHIPRESTPPPLHPASSRNVGMLAPDDPRNSPRSPRPVNLGREQFGRFHAGSSDDSSGSFETKSRASQGEER
ncbi:uncharacterized protein UTRI_00760_B [Ustilago trichophora]|uniref:Uncharacterized protein n=1 Tax=Ustilago trichophora TaxID=86804 RepID=A0A5C3DT62_9BASI|nr:uncharacterized protein UTRI_00760_B [Ustilago trichophora]